MLQPWLDVSISALTYSAHKTLMISIERGLGKTNSALAENSDSA
jgi:hypothetical protein